MKGLSLAVSTQKVKLLKLPIIKHNIFIVLQGSNAKNLEPFNKIQDGKQIVKDIEQIYRELYDLLYDIYQTYVQDLKDLNIKFWEKAQEVASNKIQELRTKFENLISLSKEIREIVINCFKKEEDNLKEAFDKLKQESIACAQDTKQELEAISKDFLATECGKGTVGIINCLKNSCSMAEYAKLFLKLVDCKNTLPTNIDQVIQSVHKGSTCTWTASKSFIEANKESLKNALACSKDNLLV